MRGKYCIVIPVYKQELDIEDETCLNRIKYVLGENVDNVYLVCPKSLNISNYTNIYSKLKVKRFDDWYFENTSTYSSLCMNASFYKKFKDYKYMLICQLDAFLVRNDIDDYCDLGYDYIGGPIYVNNVDWQIYDNKSYKVGNGGFSLRNISKFIDICDENGEFRKNNTNISWEHPYEDVFFCVTLPKGTLNIAPVEIGGKFACDRSPKIHQSIYKDRLPTGIHNIGKYGLYWVDKIHEIDERFIKCIINKYYKDIVTVK